MQGGGFLLEGANLFSNFGNLFLGLRFLDIQRGQLYRLQLLGNPLEPVGTLAGAGQFLHHLQSFLRPLLGCVRITRAQRLPC
ncbi:hypothetical protein D9M68_837250 [compost metagenome]